MSEELLISPKMEDKAVVSIGILSLETLITKLPVTFLHSTLNTYFDIVYKIVTKYKGHFQISSDKINAIFDEDAIDDALQCSLDILDEFKIVRKKSPKQNPLKVMYLGIGISYGKVLEANIGPSKKQTKRVVGEIIWKADRLQSYTNKVARQLILDESFKSVINKNWYAEKIGVVQNNRTLKKTKIYTIDYGVSSRPKSYSVIQKEIERYLQSASLK